MGIKKRIAGFALIYTERDSKIGFGFERKLSFSEKGNISILH